MPRRVNSLSNMDIDEVSLVDRGANQHAAVTIAKRDSQENEMPDLFHEDGSLLTDDNAFEGATVSDAEGNQYVLEPDVEEAPAEVGKSLSGNPFTGKIVNGGVKAGQTMNRNKAAMGAGATGAAGGFAAGKGIKKSFSETVMEDISKAHSDDERDAIFSKALADMEARSTEAATIAKAERDLRLTGEYIAKADSYGLSVSGDELGPVLYRMAETMSFEDCSVIAKVLDSASQAQDQLFEEIGKSGGGANSDIMNGVEAQASAFLNENATIEVSKAETIGAIFDENPEAYDQYLAEQRAFRG